MLIQASCSILLPEMMKKMVLNQVSDALQDLSISKRVFVQAASKSQDYKAFARDAEILQAEKSSLQDERERLLKLQAVLISQLSAATGHTAAQVNTCQYNVHCLLCLIFMIQ